MNRFKKSVIKKNGGANKYQNAGKKSGTTRRMTEDDEMQRTGNTPSMRQGTGKGKSPKKPPATTSGRSGVGRPMTGTYGDKPDAPSQEKDTGVNNRMFKSGKTRQEVQNTPGGTGSTNKKPSTKIKPDRKRIDPPKNINDVKSKSAGKPAEKAKSKPSTPPKKEGATQKKNTYAEAKKKDPKLDQYIKARNNAKKGSKEYIDAQNKINAAYGVGRQRDNIQEMKSVRPNTKVAPAAERTLKTRPAAPAKAAPAKSPIVEDSKEIKFDGPSRRADRIEKKADKISKRKAKRAAIQSAKEKLKAARRS